MLCHPDSPYIRCIGFLYLRYAVEPSSLWKWFEPYLYDEESVQVTPSLSKTLGEYVRDLLTEFELRRNAFASATDNSRTRSEMYVIIGRKD